MNYPDTDRIADRLTTVTLGRKIIRAGEVASTNTLAKEPALSGAADGTLVICERQTHGRGRAGRQWFSGDGSLCMSIIIRPKTAPELLSRYTLAFCVAAVRAMRSFGIECSIKWPNDVLADGKKLCGILSECGFPQDAEPFLVCGIGVNVNNTFTASHDSYLCHCPCDNADFEKRAVSMSGIAGHVFVREEVAAQILNEAEILFDKCKEDSDFSAVTDEYMRHFCMTDRPVTVYTSGGEICGMARGVDSLGRIEVETAEGLRTFDSADVSVRLTEDR